PIAPSSASVSVSVSVSVSFEPQPASSITPASRTAVAAAGRECLIWSSPRASWCPSPLEPAPSDTLDDVPLGEDEQHQHGHAGHEGASHDCWVVGHVGTLQQLQAGWQGE